MRKRHYYNFCYYQSRLTDFSANIRMNFLLSNDDGYLARGLKVMADALATIGDVTVVAPDRNRSGASNSLTLDTPLRKYVAENGYVYIEGTPTDCVHLAINGLLEKIPDMVISGINSGANLGNDVHYSGTVAAAMEGRFLGRPAIAISLVGDNPVHYDSAARVLLEIISFLGQHEIDPELLLNINVPDLPYDELGPMEITRLGNRHKSEPVIRETDPRGREIFWIGAVGQEQDAGPSTDFYAIKNNNISITPIHVDMTQYSMMESLNGWITGRRSDEE